MDSDHFDALSRSLTVAGSRRRTLAAVLGFGFAGASLGRTRAEKPEPCRFVYYTTEGRRIRGYGYADFASPCAPCETSRDCETTAFPHCLRDYTDLVSGTRYDLVRACGTYAVGVCGRVDACVPDVAQEGLAR